MCHIGSSFVYSSMVFPCSLLLLSLEALLVHSLLNTYSMKQPDLYYFETIKSCHKSSQILCGEYEPQASILCEL